MKNLSVLFVAGLALAAVGCGKKAAGPDCAKAVNHSMDLSKTEMKSMGVDDAMMQKMVDLGIKHCKDDKWSADAVKCMVDAKTMADSQACYEKLTKDQQDKMNKAAMALATPAGDTKAPTEPPAGSAAAGSADMTGSAATGSAAGSAEPTGSAAGSAQ